MNTLTKLALGLMGQMQPRAAQTGPMVALQPPNTSGGMGLMDALQRRASARDFDPSPLAPGVLSDLLWAAAGVNRTELGGRTAPSAMNAQEVQVYVALPQGLMLYDPTQHALHLHATVDVRRVTGYQDFVDTAPLDLIYVAQHDRMKLIPAAQRERYAYAAAGAMAQNVYLFCAAHGLSAVIRAWFDARSLASAMALNDDQQLLLCQTVGNPAAPAAS